MRWIYESLEEGTIVSLDDVIAKEGNKYPLLYELKNTEQDSEWHSEGDVHIHTQMVIDETYKIFEEKEFSIAQKYILLMAAIFHDICKPITTKRSERDGKERVIAPKHEYKGASYMFYPLMDEGINTDIIEAIILLIGHHQQAKLLVVKNKSDWHYKNLCTIIDGEMLYYHQIADMKGRTCTDLDSQIEYLEVFKLFCEESDCFNKESYNITEELTQYFKHTFNLSDSAASFLANKSRVDLVEERYTDPSVAYQKYYEHIDNHGTLNLLCGLSGTGKSTYVKELLEKYPDAVVISLDEIRSQYKNINEKNRKSIDGQVRQESTRLVKEALANKKYVIFDACNLRKDFRSKLLVLAHNYHALTEITMIVNTVKNCIDNDAKRSGRGFVGKDVIMKQLGGFEMPEPNEADIFNIKYNF